MKGYRPEVDGLRAFAVLAVLFFHAKVPGFSGGFVGVDVFFVISGYLITRLIFSDTRAGTFSLRDFYLRRARRIVPAVTALAFVVAAAAWFILPPAQLRELGGHLFASTLFFANVVYWQQADYFATKADVHPLLHLWSLSLEEQFYLVFPPLLLALRHVPRRTATRWIVALSAGSFAVAVALTHRAPHATAAFFLLPSRAWELLLGALVAIREERATLRDRMAAIPTALSVAMMSVAIVTFDTATTHPGILTLVPVGATALFLAFASPANGIGRIFAARPVVAVGLISYSLYLVHQPLLAFSRIIVGPLTPWQAATALLASLILGALCWRFIERPFRDSERMPPRRLVAVLGAGATASLLLGAIFYATHGVPSRLDPALAALTHELETKNDERRAGIRLHRCHFNIETENVDGFLERWDCLPREGTRILVVGDSIAADRAWVLREAGVEVGNLTGAGCGLVPGDDVAQPCTRLVLKARRLVASGQVHALILSNNWLGAVPAGELERIWTYWHEPGMPIAVFSGTPPFPDPRERIAEAFRAQRQLAPMPYDAVAAEQHWQSLQPLRKHGVRLLSSRDLLCGAEPCLAIAPEGPIVTDPTHLRALAVKRMARRLVDDPEWQAFYASAKGRVDGLSQVTE